ncbi:MAG: FecR domain-containing protein [Planctomycetota bacterium]|jgi:ferric-dicitrate binding protein FerR (iron transport regulator)
MNCKKNQTLIEKYISGDIKNTELAELKAHTDRCASCRERFEHVDRLESVVKSAFSSSTIPAGQASNSILSKLPATRPAKAPTVPLYKQMAVAASIFLAVGLLLGFSLARSAFTGHIIVPKAAKVPMNVAKLEGTVLVRHEGSEVWQALESGSNVHLGDTFYSAAQSAFRLEFKDESTIDLNQNSMLVLKLYNGETQFFLEHGECTANLESPHGPFFISTPHGRVEALGTEFTVTVTDE